MADNNTVISQGGVTFNPGQTVPPPPPPEPVPKEPPKPVVPETFVVPTGAEPAPFPVVPPPGQPPPQPMQPPTPPTVPPAKRGSFFGGILKFFVFLIILAGLGVAGYFGFQYYQTQQQVTITYWGLWENEAIIQPLIAEFEQANPRIKVEYSKQSYRQYRERLVSRIEAGDGPDVFRFHNTWLPMLRNVVTTVPTDIMTAAEFANTFYTSARNDLVAGDNIYGIPLETDGLGLYINEDLFAAAGATPPTTWEDVLALVPKLTAPPADQRQAAQSQEITTSAIALGTTNNVEHFSDILAVMMMQNGAKLTEPTGKEAEEALIFYRKFSDPADPMYTWNSSFDNSVTAFANNRVAMILAPSWRAFDIKQVNPALNFRIVPIPQLPGNTVSYASYWVEGVSSKSTHQKEAWEFVKFLSSRESVMKLYTEEAKTRLFGEPYARKDLADAVANDPYVGAYVSQAETARSFPLASRTFDNGLNDRMIQYLTDAVNQVLSGGSPAEALRTMSSGFTQVLGQYGLVSASAPVVNP